jgi:hypothetical protein
VSDKGPARVKTPMRAVDTQFLKKRILQFGVASISIVALFGLLRKHLLISCSAREFCDPCRLRIGQRDFFRRLASTAATARIAVVSAALLITAGGV